MKPVVVNGEVWNVRRVSPADPLLIDRTGTMRVATTDPVARQINVSSTVVSPLLDKVLLHEAAHAITISHGLLSSIRSQLPPELWVPVEEWAVRLVENHGIEAVIAASESLGRPLCINGQCM